MLRNLISMNDLHHNPALLVVVTL